jgi:hypothetical protein
MVKEEIDKESIVPYKNSVNQNQGANKEMQKKIDHTFKKHSEKKFQQFNKELDEKNTYFSRSKREEVNTRDLLLEKTKTENKFKQEEKEENDYCQKCPSFKNHCPHKNPKEQIRDKYNYPIVTSSTYGWLKPYDNLGGQHNLNSVTKTFFDKSHL